MQKQSLIVHIDSGLARRVRAFLGTDEHGYDSLSEFAEVALLNQLDLEVNGLGPTSEVSPAISGQEGKASGLSKDDSALLLRPAGPPPELVASARASEALFVLTNRLSPVKVATRVLANLASGGQWPTAKEFHRAAAIEARKLGLRLRDKDRAEGRTGAKRRSIGYPVGKDEQAALDRFIFSFAASARDGRCVGPLAILGLANCDADRIALTTFGWELAAEMSPLLDEDGGRTMSDREAQILRDAILRAPEEREAVAEFVSLVKRAAGRQTRIDELLASVHSDWSSDLMIAHRSAMLGRLSDVQALAVEGRGAHATITLLPSAEAFERTTIQEAS